MELIEHQDAKLDGAQELMGLDNQQWIEILEACDNYWWEYTKALRKTSCGDELWTIINPKVNQQFKSQMAKHSKLDEVAGQAYVCLTQIRLYHHDPNADQL